MNLAPFTVLQVVRGPTQSVQVPGLPRGAITASVVGQFTVGDGHLVGQVAGGDVLFGVPVPKLVQNVPVSGRGSAQAFGALAFRVTLGSGGVLTAQAFGVPTVTALSIPGKTVSVPGVPPSGAAPVFNPGSIPGLGMWLDASKLALADGADVYLWPDLSGLGNDMSSRVGIDNPANLKTNVYRGLSTMRFTSANGEFFWHGGTPIGTVGEVFVVTKYFGATFPEYTGFFGDATALLLLGTMGANILYPANVGSPTYYYNGVDSTATRKAPMNELAVLGLSFTPITLTPIIGVDRFTSTRYLDGDVSEIIVYDHVLTTVERTKVNDYLLAKWLGIGGAPASQFGTVTPVNVAFPPQTKPVNGLGSAQAFGTVTTKTAVTRTVGAVSSAQSFGTLAFKTTVTRTLTGLGSAQSFGVVTIRGAITRTVVGLGSAQSFGSLAFRVTLGSGGVLSAQAFGSVILSVTQPQTVQVPGLAPQFGIRSIVGQVISGDGHVVGGTDLRFGRVSFALGVVKVTVGGVGSPQSFGHPGIAQYVKVDGVQPPPEIRSIVGQVISGDGHLVGGYNLRFGFITIKTATRIPVAGLGSAQAFGTPWIAFWQPLPIPGLPSAGRFGVPLVFKVWVRTFDCAHLDLIPITCTSLDLVENECGEFVLVGAPASTLDLTTSSVEEIDLQPVGCD